MRANAGFQTHARKTVSRQPAPGMQGTARMRANWRVFRARACRRGHFSSYSLHKAAEHIQSRMSRMACKLAARAPMNGEAARTTIRANRRKTPLHARRQTYYFSKCWVCGVLSLQQCPCTFALGMRSWIRSQMPPFSVSLCDSFVKLYFVCCDRPHGNRQYSESCVSCWRSAIVHGYRISFLSL